MGNTMKKLFLLIAFGTTLVFSQDASKWSLYGGISSMNTNLEENTTNLLGTNLGFGYRFTDKLTIGMGFSQRGFTGVHGYDDSYCYWDEYNNRICFDIEDDTDEDNGRDDRHPRARGRLAAPLSLQHIAVVWPSFSGTSRQGADMPRLIQRNAWK